MEYIEGIRELIVADGEFSTIDFAIDITTNNRVVLKRAKESMIEKELQILTRIQGQTVHLMNLLATYMMDNQRVLVLPRLQEFNPSEFGKPSKIKLFLLHIMKALVTLHKFGIIHNDIHEGNILVDNNGNLVLSDYGCSLFTDIFDKDIKCTARLVLLLTSYYFQVRTRESEYLLPMIRQANALKHLADLLDKMFLYTITAEQVLAHPFLQEDKGLHQKKSSKNNISINTSVIKRKPLATLNNVMVK